MANRSYAKMETDVLLNVQERRMRVRLAGVIDDALDLAEECGWRYAIAYLISEKVPSQIIQRLLFGGGRARRRSSNAPPGQIHTWTGANDEDMNSLFEWLRERRSHH